jgi:RNA polymerase sigma-70 factor (ECF subfamily)
MSANDLSLEKLRAGDREELARLVDGFSGPVYRLTSRILGRQQDAEDALQNTFINVITHIKDFEGRSSLSTWIYRIAANEALMILRKKRPEVNLDDRAERDEDESDLTPAALVDWSGLPESELLDDEARQALERAIQNLPNTLRLVFILRDLEGLSIAETSQALNLTETNVKTRLLRARLHLREQLSIYFGERISREQDQ